jgi:hypothetical protein
MTILVELARRAVSHPQASSFVKRALGRPEPMAQRPGDISISIWSVIPIYATIFIAAIGISLVRPGLHLPD